MSRPLRADELADIVCPRAVGWPAAEQCCAALRERRLQPVTGRKVSVSHLRRISAIRLSRGEASRGVVGSDRMLSDLSSYEGDSVTMVVLEQGARVFCIVLDEPARRLVTCAVGADQRVTGRS